MSKERLRNLTNLMAKAALKYQEKQPGWILKQPFRGHSPYVVANADYDSTS